MKQRIEEEKKRGAKKAWAKPTIRPIVDGLDEIESGPQAEHNEHQIYRPSS